MAFPFAERRNAVVGRCLDAVVRRPARAGARAGGPDLSRLVVGRRERRRRRRAVRPAHSPGPAQGTAFMWLDCAVDRKSTRLNSSHSQISYAVFCLKKKK